MKKYTVYYFTQAVQTLEVEAENEQDAIKKAQEEDIKSMFYEWVETDDQYDVVEVEP
jgi:hypothetical protein